MTCVFYRDLII